MMECVVTIREFTGTTKRRRLTASYDDVRCWIVAASPEVAALYESVPVGQLHEFAIKDSRVGKVSDGAEITVAKPQMSGIDQDAVFIVINKTQRARVGGRYVVTGACYLKE